MIHRREFITLLGGAAAWPLNASAQQTRLRTIGFLGALTEATSSRWTEAFVQRLSELGWIEGRNIEIDYRWAEGRFDRSPEILASFVQRKVDVIVTHANPNIIAAKQATSIIPIVFATAGDPVGNGMVESLGRPGGNVTGLSLLAPDLVGKRFELLREALPSIRRIAVVANVGYSAAVLEATEVEAAAHQLGIDVVLLKLKLADDIVPAIVSLKGRADAIYVSTDPLLNSSRGRIASLALDLRLPTISGAKENVEAGGLMSYGPNFTDQFRRAAKLVDKILRGVKPADLPVEQPTKFELIVNLRTAKALGLNIPEVFLLRADEVIE